ncbi:glycoside hydrolase family 16 protein [Punctularia strigosozonata HHB-11173 SS5]|uniref:glycoside hydrolase family 16 protein n=1 Tax=Punctularia strigosozonata (strain HHB-11173) TaxID=741275 RepID=UPI0004417837|nr:glycoside hydrolase family 16 protein [Punctularia strigosozonata HHB-11173 SS5]EIN08822.1 glycoside hydrolase family 16 protein [Punctularia strigosozonata HHB-11173 SS5]
MVRMRSIALLFPLLARQALAYNLVREYSGLSFFDRWDFFGNWDNLTLGDVWWLDRDQAYSTHLAYINANGNAILKVDDTSNVTMGDKRNSVRIMTQDTYGVGSLFIIDIVHLPFGCSVWPAFWTMGPTWPNDGEIDILEAINRMDHNQMALHTTSGCLQSTPAYQTGETTETDCSTAAGCTVEEQTPGSYGDAFNNAGGGVWATQFDVQGIFIWFWPRKNVPSSITSSTSTSDIDISSWGPPSASYMAAPSSPDMQGSCNITEFFTAQKLVLDITLCGNWAGLPDVYAETCANAGPTGICYNDNVVGDGSNYDDAYFEIPHIRTYTTGGVGPTPTPNDQARRTSSAGETSIRLARPFGASSWWPWSLGGILLGLIVW